MKLRGLVEATNDRNMIEYVIYNLGKDLPIETRYLRNMADIKKVCYGRLWGAPPQYHSKDGNVTADVGRLRQEVIAEVRRQQNELFEELRAQAQIELQEKNLTTALFQQSSLDLFVRKMLREQPERLRDKLRGPDPLLRLLTLQVVKRRRLPLEAEVIPLLDDPSPVISQSARAALVRLARGTDFGPLPSMRRARHQQAVQKWKDWLALQKAASGETSAPPGPAVAAKPAVRFDPARAMRNILAPQEASLRTIDNEVQRLAKDLVAAKGARQGELLEHLKTSKGGTHTDALAQAIPKLPAAVQTKARDALAERLTRMKATTLKDMLQDEDAEVRRAAALACAMKEAKEQVPDLIPLLLDSESAVAAAAHASLKDLTGRDFGPHAKATPAERTLAMLAWRDWWKTQKDKRK